MQKQRLIEIFNQYEPMTPMGEDESSVMFDIIRSRDEELSMDIDEIDRNSPVYMHFMPLIQSMSAQIFLKRLKFLTELKITLGALILLLCNMSNAGKAVMYLFYLYYKLPPNTLITIQVLETEVFLDGYFSEEQLQAIWTSQKVKEEEMVDCRCIGVASNLIDYLETW